MRAFLALVRREFIEHRGAFFIAPLVLVAILFILTLLAFGVDRVDTRFSGLMVTILPIRVFEVGFAGFAMAWMVYMAFVLFFYCADGFAADKRNNAMLFWKSMPVSDLRILVSKLVAAMTILPFTIFMIALFSIVLLFGVAYVTTLISGIASVSLLGNIALVYAQMTLTFAVVLVCALLWYLPYMALVGALATAMGRWAIPLTLLLPTVISALEWVTLGGKHPFDTRVWSYLNYRSSFAPLPFEQFDDFEGLDMARKSFDAMGYIGELLMTFDWLQVGIGVLFAGVVIYLASEYRRRAPAN
jgi:ABC-2 type transport system permease protein